MSSQCDERYYQPGLSILQTKTETVDYFVYACTIIPPTEPKNCYDKTDHFLGFGKIGKSLKVVILKLKTTCNLEL